MLYLKVEDEYYYSDEGKKELAAKYNLSEESFVFARNKDIILNAFENGSIAQTTFIAPYLPENLSSEFKGIFDVIRVNNKYGLLTKRQKEENIDPMTILREKLGSNIYAPVVTFNDYIIDKASSSFISMMSNLRAIMRYSLERFFSNWRSRNWQDLFCEVYSRRVKTIFDRTKP